MPTDFRYVPTSGDISGKSVLDQTERAINELGLVMDASDQKAALALQEAENAKTTANSALLTSQEAQATAQEAAQKADVSNAAAQSAKEDAAGALARADSAYDLAADAGSRADGARSRADDAHAFAAKAENDAARAGETADTAMGVASSALDNVSYAMGVFIVTDDAIDADTKYSSANKLFLTNTECLNLPLPVPLYLEVSVNDEHTSATQRVWSANVSGTDVSGASGLSEGDGASPATPGQTFIRVASVTQDEETGTSSAVWSEWTEQGGSSKGGGLDLLDLKWSTTGLVDPGFIDVSLDNGPLLRSAYPQAWAKIKRALDAGLPSVVDDETWLAERDANEGVCGRFSTGDGSTTFRVPLLKKRVSLGAPDEDTDAMQGDFLPDQMRPITGEITSARSVAMRGSGALKSLAVNAQVAAVTTGADTNGFALDSSLLGPNYDGDITHGPLVIYTPLLKIYATVSEDSEANIMEEVRHLIDEAIEGIEPSSGLDILDLKWSTTGLVDPGFIDVSKDNEPLLRRDYPQAWAKIQRALDAGLPSVVDDETWLAERDANAGVCGRFSTGDGSTTFRVPLLKKRISLGAPDEDAGAAQGDFLADQMRPITGETNFRGNVGIMSNATYSGALNVSPSTTVGYGVASDVDAGSRPLRLDSSLLGPNYDGDITHGPLVVYTPLLKIYATVSENSEANIMEEVRQLIDEAIEGIEPASGLDILDLKWSTTGLVDPGFIDVSKDNEPLLRRDYPQAWAKICRALEAGLPSVVDDETWLAERDANNGVCGRFSTGDGSTTFRVPLLQKRVSLGAPDEEAGQGDFLADQMRPITGLFAGGYGDAVPTEGAFSYVGNKGAFAPGGTSVKSVSMDSSLLGPNYDGDITHGPLVVYTPLLKIYATVGEDSEANIMEEVRQLIDEAIEGIEPASGLDILDLKWSTTGLVDPGFIDVSKDNGLLLRNAYPQAWAKVQRALDAGLPSVVDDETWLAERDANEGVCGRFSTGDGSTTFRVPLLKKRVSLAAPDEEAGTGQGDFLPDQMRPITAPRISDFGTTSIDLEGAVTKGMAAGWRFNGLQSGGYYFTKLDSSRLGSSYDGDITHGPLVIYTPLLKMFGEVAEANEEAIMEGVRLLIDEALEGVGASAGDSGIFTTVDAVDVDNFYEEPARVLVDMKAHSRLRLPVEAPLYLEVMRSDDYQFFTQRIWSAVPENTGAPGPMSEPGSGEGETPGAGGSANTSASRVYQRVGTPGAGSGTLPINWGGWSACGGASASDSYVQGIGSMHMRTDWEDDAVTTPDGKVWLKCNGQRYDRSIYPGYLPKEPSLLTMVPKMTSNTSSYPFIASSSSLYGEAYSPWCAFDGTVNKWFATKPNAFSGSGTGVYTGDEYLQLDCGMSTYLSSYAIASRSADGRFTPHSWTFQASDDGVAWEILDTQEDHATAEWKALGAGKLTMFKLSQPVQRRFYRLNITASNAGNYCDIGELALYGANVPDLSFPGINAYIRMK